MGAKIFKNPEVQAQFDLDGYVVIDFISAGKADTIAEKFYQIHPEIPKGFYCDASSPDDALKQEIFDHADKILREIIGRHFCDYKKLSSTFLCKAPGPEGKVSLHQDWTIVDESKYSSIVIWIPTADTDEKNGTVRVIPGSHLFFDIYRSRHIDLSYRGNEELLWKNMIAVPVKAGQALVLNNAVLHGSSPNFSDKERLAIAYALVSKDAPLIFYYKDKSELSTKVEKFSMPDDFFQRYHNIGERPLFGEVIDEFESKVPAYSTAKITGLLDLVKKYGENYGPGAIAEFNRNFKEPIIAETPANTSPLTDSTSKQETDAGTWVDERTFFERYTPANIITEIKKKLYKIA